MCVVSRSDSQDEWGDSNSVATRGSWGQGGCVSPWVRSLGRHQGGAEVSNSNDCMSNSLGKIWGRWHGR